MKPRSSTSSGEKTAKAAASDAGNVSEILPLVYDELRRLARRYMARERPGQSLQATALVHEAYLRLIKGKERPWRNRAHFYAIAANSMRRILVERARARGAAKRGGSRVRVSMNEEIVAGGSSIDLLALDEALSKLAGFDPQLAHIVELRFFGGLSIEETAEAVSTSPATVKRSWSMARAWLKRELSGEWTRES
jgi:RNA polymerase sigma factor (TIGR02999 family)